MEMVVEEISDIDLLFIVLTGSVSLVINRALVRKFKSQNINLTTDQFVVLAHLWQENGLTQQGLCNKTSKDKPSMTRLIDSLESQGFVERVNDSSDRRINLIYLTELGAEMKQEASEATIDVVEEALQGSSNEQMTTCRSVLKTILRNLA